MILVFSYKNCVRRGDGAAMLVQVMLNRVIQGIARYWIVWCKIRNAESYARVLKSRSPWCEESEMLNLFIRNRSCWIFSSEIDNAESCHAKNPKCEILCKGAEILNPWSQGICNAESCHPRDPWCEIGDAESCHPKSTMMKLVIQGIRNSEIPQNEAQDARNLQGWILSGEGSVMRTRSCWSLSSEIYDDEACHARNQKF
jgi:hypothetical protein